MKKTNKPSKEIQEAKKFAEEISKENSVKAYEYFKDENPQIAYNITKKYNLIEENINLLEKNKSFYEAGVLAENKGMIKKAIDNYVSAGLYNELKRAYELVSYPINFSENTQEKQEQIELVPKLMKKFPQTTKEIYDELKENFYYQN